MSEAVINSLIKRKEEITIEIVNLQRSIKEKQVDINHLDATICIFNGNPEKSQRVKVSRGGIARRLFDIMRTSDKPMTVFEINEKMLELGDKTTPKNIGVTLYNYSKKGMVKSIPAGYGKRAFT